MKMILSNREIAITLGANQGSLAGIIASILQGDPSLAKVLPASRKFNKYEIYSHMFLTLIFFKLRNQYLPKAEDILKVFNIPHDQSNE